VTGREYLIDASAYWRIDRGAVLAGAWRDHLERGLVWICPPTEMEICRRASKDQHAVHLREFAERPTSGLNCITGLVSLRERSRRT
jgi:hypothetical protein